MTSTIPWGRIILAAILLEIAITAVAVPVGIVFGTPMQIQPGEPAADATVFYVVVALACLVLGAVFGAWAVRRAASRFALHGLLVGLVAMALYFGMCSLAPGGLAGVVDAYGVGMFVTFNALRTLGCVVGAWHRGTRLGRVQPAP
jgi:hypothetical protein